MTVAYNRKIIEDSKDKCRVSLSFINYIHNMYLGSKYQNKQWNSEIPICCTPKLDYLSSYFIYKHEHILIFKPRQKICVKNNEWKNAIFEHMNVKKLYWGKIMKSMFRFHTETIRQAWLALNCST